MINQFKILKELDFERLSGTDGEKKGREVICKYLTEIGAKYTVEEFELNSFEAGTATIEVDGKTFDAIPWGLDKSQTIKGELIFLENLDIVNYNEGAYKDKIVISYYSSKSPARIMKDSGIKAYIGIGKPYRKATCLSHRQKSYTEKANIPSVNVAYSQAEKLIKQSGKMAKIAIKQTPKKYTAHNIVVDIKGTEADNNLCYAVGHYDSVANSHGTLDNAAGSVNLIKLVEYFTKNKPKRDFKVIFFSGEELGLLGSTAYVKQHEDEVKKRAKLVINIDLSGDIIGMDTLIVLGTNELKGYSAGVTKEDGLMFKDNLGIYSSDCMPFSVYEVPSVNIARVGGKGLFQIHTADDTIKVASPRGLENTYNAAKGILKRVLNAKVFPVKKEIDKSLRTKIENYLWQSRLEKPELKWEESYKK